MERMDAGGSVHSHVGAADLARVPAGAERHVPVAQSGEVAATSKRVRELLGHLQWRVPVALRMSRRASMESVASSLPGMLAWCSVVRLNVSMRKIDAEGVRILARALEQCSSLTTLDLGFNEIGAEGARSLASVLGQCWALVMLDLRRNRKGAEGVQSLAEGLGQCSSLATLYLGDNDIGDEGIAMIRMSIPDRVQLFV